MNEVFPKRTSLSLKMQLHLTICHSQVINVSQNKRNLQICAWGRANMRCVCTFCTVIMEEAELFSSFFFFPGYFAAFTECLNRCRMQWNPNTIYQGILEQKCATRLKIWRRPCCLQGLLCSIRQRVPQICAGYNGISRVGRHSELKCSAKCPTARNKTETPSFLNSQRSFIFSLCKHNYWYVLQHFFLTPNQKKKKKPHQKVNHRFDLQTCCLQIAVLLY